MKNKPIYPLLTLIAALAFWAACSRPATATVDHRELILQSWGEQVIVPLYADFATQSAALSAQTAALCEAPDAAKLEEAREAWRVARASWKRTEVFAFGPYDDFPARYGSMIDFWPARAESIDETLTGTGELSAEHLGTLGAASRGLPAVEYLLFDEQEDQTTLQKIAEEPRYCPYLVAATQDLQAQAEGISKAWDPAQGDYLGQLVDPEAYPDGMFMDRQESVSEIVNRMAFTIDNIRRDKLGKPAGESSGQPSPESVESRFSGESLDDIRHNLETIALLFEGDGSEDHYFLADHPRLTTRPELTEAFREQMAASRAALDAIPEPLSDSCESHQAEILAAIEALGALQRTIQVDIINALSLTRTFNDSDGD